MGAIYLNGISYSGGGDSGGGTTVIANPEGEPTDDLEKLQVGNVVYSLPEGSEPASISREEIDALFN